MTAVQIMPLMGGKKLKKNNAMRLYVQRHLPDWSTVTVPCTIEVLAEEDLDNSIRLHNEVARGLSPRIFVASSPDDIRRVFLSDGLAIGARFEDRMICVRTTVTSQDWVKELLADYAIPENKFKNAAVTDFCVVDREFRGNNIQFLTQFYAENIISREYSSIITTVSPMNIFSLQNVLACGYYIFSIVWTYGGYLRYVLKKNFVSPLSLWTQHNIRIPIRDITKQQEAIARGQVGYRLIRGPKGFSILYGDLATEI